MRLSALKNLSKKLIKTHCVEISFCLSMNMSPYDLYLLLLCSKNALYLCVFTAELLELKVLFGLLELKAGLSLFSDEFRLLAIL